MTVASEEREPPTRAGRTARRETNPSTPCRIGHNLTPKTGGARGPVRNPAGLSPTPTVAPPIRCGIRTPAERTKPHARAGEADPVAQPACTDPTLEPFRDFLSVLAGDAGMGPVDAAADDFDELSETHNEGDPNRIPEEARGAGRIYRKHRLSKGQLDLLDEMVARAEAVCGEPVPYPNATRALFVHVLFCYSSYRYRYDETGVPIPWYCIADLAEGVQKTERVWGPLEAAGLIEVRHFRKGVCRRYVLPADVAVAFAEARGGSATRFDALTGNRTRARYQTELTYDGKHSWKEKSGLVYDVLSYWRGARCLANKPAMEAYLERAKEAAHAAQNAAEEAGRALSRVKAALPWGPLTVADTKTFEYAKGTYRRARRAAEKAMSSYAQDDHCWGVACDQSMKPAEGYPAGIVEFTPAYEVQMLSGRLTFRGGGPQNLSREAKAAFYSGIPGLVNYDLIGSQTRKLVEEFEDAVAAGAELDLTVLTDYDAQGGKDALAERHGVSRDVFKRAEHAPKFGAGFPHHTFEAAWKLASAAAYEKLEDHGWSYGGSRFRIWEERVARELPTMARAAYDVAGDAGVPEFDDPEAVYALLKAVYGPMAKEIKKWRRWLVEEHWAAHSKPGGDGRFVEGPCGFAFTPHHFEAKERDTKYATNRLQGGEACHIHTLTLLGPKYGYEVLANEHDGLVVLGAIPEAAEAEARALSGFRTAELEPKPFWKGSAVGLPGSWLPVDETAHPTDTTPCVSTPTPEATAGPSTSSSAPTASATTPATGRTGSGSSAGTRLSARTARPVTPPPGRPSGASASPTRSPYSTATSSSS